jgi:hypothetical protein
MSVAKLIEALPDASTTLNVVGIFGVLCAAVAVFLVARTVWRVALLPFWHAIQATMNASVLQAAIGLGLLGAGMGGCLENDNFAASMPPSFVHWDKETQIAYLQRRPIEAAPTKPDKHWQSNASVFMPCILVGLGLAALGAARTIRKLTENKGL